MSRSTKPVAQQGIAHELARTKAELASAQETIAWQRAEIDRITKIALQNAKGERDVV